MFYISRIGTGFMDLGLMYFSVNVMNFNDVYSKVFSNFIVVIANYIISRYYIFSEKERV
jgi:putative flippase GtrA